MTYRVEVVERAAEAALLGEHADHACAARLVLDGQGRRVADGRQRTGGRAAALDLGDDPDAWRLQGGERVDRGRRGGRARLHLLERDEALAGGDVLPDTGHDVGKNVVRRPAIHLAHDCSPLWPSGSAVALPSRLRLTAIGQPASRGLRAVGSSPLSSAVHSEASARARACSGSGRPPLVARRQPAPPRAVHARPTRPPRRPSSAAAIDSTPQTGCVATCGVPAHLRVGVAHQAHGPGGVDGGHRRDAPATPRRARRARRAHRPPGGPRRWWRSPRRRRPARRARARSPHRPPCGRRPAGRRRRRGAAAPSSPSASRASPAAAARPHRPPAPPGSRRTVSIVAASGRVRVRGSRRWRWPAARPGPCCASRVPRAPACCRRRRRPPPARRPSSRRRRAASPRCGSRSPRRGRRPRRGSRPLRRTPRAGPARTRR